MIKGNPLSRLISLGAVMLLTATIACSADNAKERADCNIQLGPCIGKAGSGTEVTFDITPRPVKSMAELLFTVTVRKDGKPITGADVTLDLTMPGMVMGKNNPGLSPGKDGRYAGKGVIIRCPSGKKVWKAEIIVSSKHGTETASFVFEVI
jgi:hypothetical protein